MIIEKNFDMKIKVDTDIVSKYLNEVPNIKDSEKELDDLIERCDPAALKYFVASYMKKLKSDDPDAFNSFLGVQQKEETPKDESVNGYKPRRELREGDSIFLRVNIPFALHSPYWSRYEVTSIRDTKSEQAIYVESVNEGDTYRIEVLKLAELVSRGFAYISYQD